MAGHAASAMSRFMNAYLPGVVPPPPQQQQQQEVDKQPDKQRGGGGTLFDGIEGIPTTAKSIQQYKKATAPAARVTKRKSAATIRFNY
jgi:alanine dehydrogenase